MSTPALGGGPHSDLSRVIVRPTQAAVCFDVLKVTHDQRDKVGAHRRRDVKHVDGQAGEIWPRGEGRGLEYRRLRCGELGHVAEHCGKASRDAHGDVEHGLKGGMCVARGCDRIG